jgi:hypothetical protein
MSEYRKPPKPLHYDTAPKGECRYCGEPIIKNGKPNLRANWHPKCVEAYRLIHFPRDTRRAVWKRDKGLCASCGVLCPKKAWDLDHRRPLIEAEGRIEFWELPNLQILCKPCHKAKTGAEATARAEARKAAKASVTPLTNGPDESP